MQSHLVEPRARLQRRDRALRAARAFFHERDFIEADTPQLVPAPGTEPHIDALPVSVRLSMTTTTTTASRFLITSPELALKRVIAAGVPRVFQIVHVFRDGERGRRHIPEFTMLEWYRGPGTLADVVDDTLGLIGAVANAIGNQSGVDVAAAPESFTVAEAFLRFAKVDLGAALDEMRAGDALALPRRVQATGEMLRPGADFDDAFFQVMGNHVEPAIGNDRLAFLHRWPAQMAVLARLDDDPRYARRFEAYARGLELCNAFDELTDADEQRARFVADNATRRALGKPEVPLDEDFLQALPDMPSPSAGNALGFDRLLMLLAGADDIDDVTALPFR
ncbi:MAG: EF-P lysine aminoacylase EpmA [Deltaproteobacteria bacterium]|nr:EF-P lysine aminoacylase EpmA [Deltaproteobacteria bacterium]